MKMTMTMKFLTIICLILIVIITTTTTTTTMSAMSYTYDSMPHGGEQEQQEPFYEVLNAKASTRLAIKHRAKRGIFWDFLQKMITTKNLIVDQYTDTKNTLNDAYNILNEGFSDPAPAKPTIRPIHTETTTKTSSEEASDEMKSTTEQYQISRYELGRILGRSFRGLQRLQRIEFQDALNQSHYNIREYKEEARKQFANSLAVEVKDKFKSLKG